MNIQSRKEFIKQLGIGTIGGFGMVPLLADSKKNKDRFHIGIQEYTFHRWLNSGKLDHLDYPALVKKNWEFPMSNIGTVHLVESIPIRNMSENWSNGQGEKE